MALLGTSVAQVFFPAASKEYNDTGDLSGIVSKMFERLIQIGVFPMVALALLGGPLSAFIFGKNWTEAGVYAQILSAYVLFQFVSSPLSAVFAILQRQGTGLAITVALLLGRTLALLLGARIGGPRVALAAYSVASVSHYSFICYWVLRNSHVYLRPALKTLLKYVSLSCLILIPASLGAYIGRSTLAILPGFGFAVGIYLYGLYRFDHTFHTILLHVARKLRSGRQQSVSTP